MVRMVCVSATAKNNQWCECWAHGLSALDHVPPNDDIRKRYLHDLFCFLGHAAGRCFIRHVTVFKALDYAEKYTFNLEHSWKRLLVFHDLTVHWGFFHLENQVFEKGLQVIPGKTDYFYQLLKIHLKSLMHQVENILLYQWARQKFHEKCNKRTCRKPMNVEYSYLTADDLMHDIDFWSRVFEEPGVSEYYSGMIHVYSACRSDSKQTGDHSAHFVQAMYYFKQCIGVLRCTYQRYTDASFLLAMFTKKMLKREEVRNKYNYMQHLVHNQGASETLFRLLLLVRYFPEEFVMTNGTRPFVGSTANYYLNATNGHGYRLDLLRMCDTPNIKHHGDPDSPADYPPMTICMEKELIDDVAATRYWKREVNRLLPFSQSDPERPSSCPADPAPLPPSTPPKRPHPEQGPCKRPHKESKRVRNKKVRRRALLSWDIETVPEHQQTLDHEETEDTAEDTTEEESLNFFLPTSKVFLGPGSRHGKEVFAYGKIIANHRTLTI
jgi:hypothetical protein